MGVSENIIRGGDFLTPLFNNKQYTKENCGNFSLNVYNPIIYGCVRKERQNISMKDEFMTHAPYRTIKRDVQLKIIGAINE